VPKQGHLGLVDSAMTIIGRDLFVGERVLMRLVEWPADLIEVALCVGVDELVSMALKHLRVVTRGIRHLVVLGNAMRVAARRLPCSDLVLLVFFLVMVVLISLPGLALRGR
jgi:hypothetical protein